MQIIINVQLPINNDKDYQLVHTFGKDDFDNIENFLIQIQEDALECVSPSCANIQDAMEEAADCRVYVSIEDDRGDTYDWDTQGCGIDITSMWRNSQRYLSSDTAFQKMRLRYNR